MLDVVTEIVVMLHREIRDFIGIHGEHKKARSN